MLIAKGNICHGAVFDERHCKVEQFGVEDDADEKHVDYYAFNREMAARVKESFERAPRGSLAEAA